MAKEKSRLLNSYTKASQEYFKEKFEYFSTLIGIVMLLAMTGFGIYLSQVAISTVVGAEGVMFYFSWAASISMSPLEIAGIKLLGNLKRSVAIQSSNFLEHTIATWVTYGLFGFDIFTNWWGLYIVALAVIAKTVSNPSWKSIGFGGWLIIICFGALMAVSEVLVGWMIRANATALISSN